MQQQSNPNMNQPPTAEKTEKGWHALQRPGGIFLKLAAVTVALIALITVGFSLVVTRILDDSLRQALLQRGRSLALGAATPAGYSILSGDLLALDNLAAKLAEAQEDIVYLAILDRERTILAHSRLEMTGDHFEDLPGGDFSTPEILVAEGVRDGRQTYEFRAPIRFAEQHLGDVVVGIDAAPYEVAKASARRRMTSVALLVLGIGLGGTLLLATRFTAPIKKLSCAVARLRAGDYGVQVESISRDELGELTANFNAMAHTLRVQKETLEASSRELEEAYFATVRILAAALDARDNYTLDHSSRVAALSLRIGLRLGLDPQELKELEISCFLHDIGKIRVPDNVLNKPGPLDREEAGLIRRHPQQGAEILGLAHSLRKYVPVVRHHHEWYDGSGYPDGLQGEEIPLFAQIVAIADAYDAMTTCRPYRPGRSLEAAIEEIRTFRGRQFAPRLTDLFIESLQQDTEEPCSFLGAALC